MSIVIEYLIPWWANVNRDLLHRSQRRQDVDGVSLGPARRHGGHLNALVGIRIDAARGWRGWNADRRTGWWRGRGRRRGSKTKRMIATRDVHWRGDDRARLHRIHRTVGDDPTPDCSTTSDAKANENAQTSGGDDEGEN